MVLSFFHELDFSPPAQPLSRGALLRSIVLALATGLGTGYSPFAPGTVGTLVGIPVFIALSFLTWPVQILIILILLAGSCWIAGKAEEILLMKDASRIVIDEIIGFQFALLLIAPSLPHILAGFILFRFFDIIKIFPANVCETKLPGGYAVVLDDVVAGIYANIVLRILIMWTGL